MTTSTILVIIAAVALILVQCSVSSTPVSCSSSQEHAELETHMYRQTGNQTIWSSCNYPNPQADWQKCKRSEKSWICDPDQLLTDQQADDIDGILSQPSYCRCEGLCSPVYHASPVLVLLARDIHTVDRSGDVCIGGSCGDLYPQLDPTGRDPTMTEIEASLNSFLSGVVGSWSPGRCSDEVVILYIERYQRLLVHSGSLAEKKLGDIYESSQTDALIRLSDSSLISALQGLVADYTSALYPKNNTAFIVGVTLASIVGVIIIFGIIITVVFCKREFDQGKSCSQVWDSCIGGEWTVIFGGNRRTGYKSTERSPAVTEPLA